MADTRDPTFSRDLLQRFTCGGDRKRFPVKPKEAPENVELSLGLSLNGRFGVKPERTAVNDANIDGKLSRASSVNEFVNLNFPVDVELSLYSPLTRTCSLPPEMEAEWRKRKELQSLRRSEAKRKRVEKRNGSRFREVGLKQSPPSPSPSPSPPPAIQFSSQGSIGSQGSGGSSGVSDLESKKVGRSAGGGRWPDVETMPCVSTKVEGSDGKKIQGFLYRYGKGEEVRIVCVCHGSFLTPSEFVRHGGGEAVEHPLRHIVVTPSLFS